MRLIRILWKIFIGFSALVGLLVIALLVVAFLALQELERLATRPEPIPERLLLTLDLASGLSPAERKELLPFLDGKLTLREALDALTAARDDPRVAGLLLEPGGADLGLAALQELRDALAAFREAGKPVYAFAPTLSGELGDGTATYTLASVADRIWMQPSGDLAFSGFRLESPYFGKILRDLGIEARFDRRGPYKGAVEPLTEEEMSAEVRENLGRLLTSWAEEAVAAVARSRGLDEVRVRELMDRPPLFAEEAMESGLIDAVGYRDEAQAALAEESGVEEPALTLADYAAALTPEEPSGARTIAVIEGTGEIVLAEPGPGFGPLVMSAPRMARAFEEAAADPEVAAIVFRIDSPGGSYVASDVIARALERAQARGKAVVASFGNVAASGGYFVAAPAETIVAEPGSITGSIGVLSGKPVFAKLWGYLDLTWSNLQEGRNAGYWSINEDFTEEQWQHLQASLDRTYADFLRRVSEGRGLPLEKLEGEIAGGRVWSGADARRLGLVDELGGFDAAVEEARKLALPPGAPFRLVSYPQPEGVWERLRRFFDAGLASEGELRELRQVLAGLRLVLPQSAWLKGPAQGRTLRAPLN